MPVRRSDVDRRALSELLELQSGTANRAQLIAVGCSDSWIRARLRSGQWQRLCPRVYRAGTGSPGHETRVWAALLYAGPGARASHETAAYLAGLIDREPATTHVTVPAARRVKPTPQIVLHRMADIARRPRVGYPPRSRNEDTVLDLVATAPDELAIVALVTAALQRRLTTSSLLRQAMELRKRLRGRAVLTELVGDGVDGVHSALEWRYFRDVERAHRLPKAHRQQAAMVGGKRVFRDVPYVEYGVVVELDGRLWHAGTAFRDMARDNATAQRGEVTLRYGFSAVVGQACAVAVQVASVLQQRGWEGALRRCGPACAVRQQRGNASPF